VEEVELGAGLIDDLPRGRILITKGSNGLGFNIRGGIDAPYVKADKGASRRPGSSATLVMAIPRSSRP
jgi:hypothetical protein